MSMKRKLVTAAALLTIATPALADDAAYDKQLLEVIGCLADAKLAVKQCPEFKLNENEVVLWSAKLGLAPEDMESPKMNSFMLLATNSRMEAQKKAGQTSREICDSWWAMYGTDGDYHSNLLLKR